MLTSGVDLVGRRRIQKAIERYGWRFLERVFTAQELGECSRQPASLAARFAAKEAVSKALGTGIGVIGWLEVEILRETSRKPILILHGNASRLSIEQGIE